MTDIIESPIVCFKNRNGRRASAVLFKGKVMRHSTAARIVEYRADLRRIAGEGHSMAKTARLIGFSTSLIRAWCKLLGIHVKPYGKRRRCQRYDRTGWEEVIKAGVAAGKTQGQVAAQLHVPHMLISRYCLDHGINWKELKRQSKEARTHGQN